MQIRLVLLSIAAASVLGAAACDGPKGPTGTSGARGPGFVWKDAAGNIVEGAVGVPIGAAVGVDYPASSIGHRSPMHVAFLDSSSRLWLLDPGTGGFSATFEIEQGFPGVGRNYWFAGADCTGETFLKLADLPPPRSVVSVTPALASAFFVAVPDDSAAQSTTPGSFLLGTACILNAGTTFPAFSESALEALPHLTPPATPLAPLHMERG